MKRNLSNFTLAALTLALAAFASGPATAQVAGESTTVGISVTEMTQVAMGWSVKKTLLGKTIYSNGGEKIGAIDDLIISPDRSVSYVIVGAGGFVGVGRHDVAIPVARIEDQSGKLVLPGATKDTIKAMPEFAYATDSLKRDQFVAAAEKDIATGKAKVADLEKKSGAAATAAKTRIDLQIVGLKGDVKSAESRLTEMKQATVARWKEFEAGVNTATARLRKSIETAAG